MAIHFADLNGDGRMDIFKHVNASYVSPQAYDCSTGVSGVYFSAAVLSYDFTRAICFNKIPNLTREHATIMFLDVNGDGADYLVFQGGDVGVAHCAPGYGGVMLSARNGTFLSSECFKFFSHKDHVTLVPTDTNADGLVDLVVVTNEAYKSSSACNTTTLGLVLSNGNGTFTTVQCSRYTIRTANRDRFSHLPLLSADLNADRRMDLVYQIGAVSEFGCLPYTIAVLLSSGDGTFAQTICTGVLANPAYAVVLVGDFNGDHQADLFVQMTSLYAYGSGSGIGGCNQHTTGRVYLSNSTYGNIAMATFTNTSLSCLPFDVNFDAFNLLSVDMDRDGLSDLVAQVSPTYTSSNNNRDCAGYSGIIYLSTAADPTNTNNDIDVFGNPICQQNNMHPDHVSVGLADFNGDGDAEILLINNVGYTLTNCTGSTTTLLLPRFEVDSSS
jgi:hypothetical protein